MREDALIHDAFQQEAEAYAVPPLPLQAIRVKALEPDHGKRIHRRLPLLGLGIALLPAIALAAAVLPVAWTHLPTWAQTAYARLGIPASARFEQVAPTHYTAKYPGVRLTLAQAQAQAPKNVVFPAGLPSDARVAHVVRTSKTLQNYVVTYHSKTHGFVFFLFDRRMFSNGWLSTHLPHGNPLGGHATVTFTTSGQGHLAFHGAAHPYQWISGKELVTLMTDAPAATVAHIKSAMHGKTLSPAEQKEVSSSVTPTSPAPAHRSPQ
ncbi:MAG: hypothetical protein ACYDHD_08935 [Vulcanimicrobiaceae bacterium]